MDHPATIRKPGEGRRLGVVGDTYRFLATGDDTAGKYAMFEALVPPGGGPPPHVHTREEESFLVLEGEMTFQLEQEKIVAGPGMFLNVPTGSLHCFRNDSGRMAKMLITVAPAGLEEMFFEVGQPIPEGTEIAPPPAKSDIEKLLKIAPNYGITILVPHH